MSNQPPVPPDDDPLARLRRRAAGSSARPPEPALPDEPALPVEPAETSDLPEVEEPTPAVDPPAVDPPAAVAPAGPADPVAPVQATDPAAWTAVSSDPIPLPSHLPTPPVAPGEPGSEPAGGVGRTRRPLLAVSVVVMLLLSALAAVSTLRLSSAHAEDDARPQILAAAVEGVTNVATYSYRTLAADRQAAADDLAEPFRSSYLAKFKTQVTPLADKYHASSKATIDSKFGAAIVSQSGDSTATVLVYLDQTSNNSQLSAPRLDQTRVLVTLQHVGSRWLISNLRTI